MKQHLLATATAAALALSTTLADAQTAAPVSLQDIQIFQNTAGQSVSLPGNVSLAFTNHAAQTATRVQFAVVADGSVVAILTEDGSFAPGATAHGSWQDMSTSRAQHVDVARVTFADGSSWSNEELPPARRQAAVSSEVM